MEILSGVGETHEGEVGEDIKHFALTTCPPHSPCTVQQGVEEFGVWSDAEHWKGKRNVLMFVSQ